MDRFTIKRVKRVDLYYVIDNDDGAIASAAMIDLNRACKLADYLNDADKEGRYDAKG